MKTKMKIISTIMATIAMITVSGCSSNKLDVKEKVQNETMQNELSGAPKWVMTAMPEDSYIYGVGVSESVGELDISFQRTIAISLARDEISRTIAIKTKNMLKTFKERTGTGKRSSFDKVLTSVTKQITSQELNGSTAQEMWISRSGRLYVLVKMPRTNAMSAAKDAVNTSFKNDRAMWQKFQAKEAQAELDNEIEKEFVATVVEVEEVPTSKTIVNR